MPAGSEALPRQPRSGSLRCRRHAILGFDIDLRGLLAFYFVLVRMRAGRERLSFAPRMLFFLAAAVSGVTVNMVLMSDGCGVLVCACVPAEFRTKACRNEAMTKGCFGNFIGQVCIGIGVYGDATRASGQRTEPSTDA